MPHTKNHDSWNTLKKKLDSLDCKRPVYFHEREVWFCSIGHNIGYEEDGKGPDFSRPVIVIRKIGAQLFIGIPLTTSLKLAKYHFDVGKVGGKFATALMAQTRPYSAKRMIHKIDIIPVHIFSALKAATKDFIFH